MNKPPPARGCGRYQTSVLARMS